MTMQSQNPYFTPQAQQQFQPQGFVGGGYGQQPWQQQVPQQFGQQGYAAQQHPQFADQQMQLLPGYQPVVFQVPQQLVPELVGTGYGQPVTPILPIAYAPIITAGQHTGTQPWPGQQYPQATQQFGQQPWQQQYGGQGYWQQQLPQQFGTPQQFGAPQHLQHQFGPQHITQRPTLW